ncbi:MAG: phosphate ABC transporter permease subunit PstC [Planctomycetota bacterium]
MSDGVQPNFGLDESLRKSRSTQRVREAGIKTSLFACAAFSILVTFSIIVVLFTETSGFFGIHGDDTPGMPNHDQLDPDAAYIAPSQPRIQELRVYQIGPEQHEYLEVAVPTGTSGLTYVVLGDQRSAGGSAGVVEHAIDLSPATPNRDGLLLIAEQNKVFGQTPDVQTTLGLSEEHSVTHMLVRDWSGRVGDALDENNDGTLDREPWSAVVDAIGLVAGTLDIESAGVPVYADARLGGSEQVPAHVERHPTTGEWEVGVAESTYVTFREFITGTKWQPLLGADKSFGIWPLVWSTFLVAGIAMCVAVPFGLVTAIFLSEYAPRRLRAVLKPVLEILAGIPTVVYGFFALVFITPVIREGIFGTFVYNAWSIVDRDADQEAFRNFFDTYNATSAGLAVGIMTLPMISSLSEDALQAVPRSLREGAYACGGTKFDVSIKVVLPAALSGIVAAILLAIARAVGETMIVALAAGGLSKMFSAPTEQCQTMTAYMVQIFLGDASNFGPEYYSSYAVAAMLFIITLCLTILGNLVLKKFREEYE